MPRLNKTIILHYIVKSIIVITKLAINNIIQ